MSDKVTPPDFKKGDMRRMWFILGAVATQDQPTLTTLVRETGMPKASVNDLLNKVIDGQIPTLKMTKQDAVYVVEDWGDLVNKNSVISFFMLARSDKPTYNFQKLNS